ncbi:MAG: hypothetical protein LBC99_09785 [Spirochaetota bacterium]|jgi:hypothetical protein|nr:hypothetical protein [Spirochaetota bacterium]
MFLKKKHASINRSIVFCALLWVCLPGGSAYTLSVWESGKGDRFEGAAFENVRMIRSNDGTEALRLADNEWRTDAAVDLLLRGNSREEMYSPWYTIRAEDVIIDTVLPFMGTGSMRFVSPENRIVLVPQAGALLAETEDMGSFSVDFWIYPLARSDEEDVFSRQGSVVDAGGRATEIEFRITFRKNRLALLMRNLFRDADGRFRDVEISGETLCMLKEWQHIAFSFDALTGKFSRLADGREDGVVWVCDTGAYGGSPLRAAFPKAFKRNAQLGGGFRGSLDSFRIRRISWDNPNLARFSEQPGRVTSRVLDMGTQKARLASLSWDAETPAGSAVFFEYRIADSIFPAHQPSLFWIRAQNGNEDIQAKEGRYLQWRATLVGSEQGKFSPILRSVRLAWNAAYRPQVPVEFKVYPGDRRALLSWRGNLDDVAGYRIYIGNERGEYLHPSSPIDVPLEFVSRSQPEYVLYNLENDRLYYFAVAAYTEDGMQSGFSREVYARPGELERFPSR